jgi:hypothetical protein
MKASLPPLPERPLSPQLEKLERSASEEAARLRGLPFSSQIGMVELSPWEYGSRASAMAKVLGGEELERLGRLASAGGILPEGTDLKLLAASFAAMSASASYSPVDKRVLLVNHFNDKSLLTHELTHALQDEHFDLLRMLTSQPYNFDRSEALFAVIEGDAMNVQRRAEEGNRYEKVPLDTIAKEEDSRFQEYRQSVGTFFQPLLTETFVFRYRDGARFVEAVRRLRGEKGVDELFRNPPASSEQILHFDKFFAGEQPRDASVSTSGLEQKGWRLSSETSLGEIGVRGLLMSGVSASQAVKAATGWGGDRAFLFEKDGAAPLFVWRTVWDKQSDAAEFFAAYKALKGHQKEPQSSLDHTSPGSSLQWQANGRTTIMKQSGDSVLIIRCADADVAEVLSLIG